MTYLNSTDLLIRKQLLTIKLSNIGNDYIDSLIYGKKCVNSIKSDIQYIVGVLNMLSRYSVITNGVTEDDNCVTESELHSILDNASKKYELCFKPINYSY